MKLSAEKVLSFHRPKHLMAMQDVIVWQKSGEILWNYLIDKRKCNYCGKERGIKEDALTFPQLCHGCRGYSIVCPQNAIAEEGVYEYCKKEKICALCAIFIKK
jgi:MinD superfamily P-loop ATPase